MSKLHDNTYWFKSEDKTKSEYCYFIIFNKWLKIGYTTNLLVRFNAIRFALPEECKLIGYFKTPWAGCLEEYFIRNLTDYVSTRGEWVLYEEDNFKKCVEVMSAHYNIKLITNG